MVYKGYRVLQLSGLSRFPHILQSKIPDEPPKMHVVYRIFLQDGPFTFQGFISSSSAPSHPSRNVSVVYAISASLFCIYVGEGLPLGCLRKGDFWCKVPKLLHLAFSSSGFFIPTHRKPGHPSLVAPLQIWTQKF